MRDRSCEHNKIPEGLHICSVVRSPCVLAQALHEGGVESSGVAAFVRTALVFKYICILISGNISILRACRIWSGSCLRCLKPPARFLRTDVQKPALDAIPACGGHVSLPSSMELISSKSKVIDCVEVEILHVR